MGDAGHAKDDARISVEVIYDGSHTPADPAEVDFVVVFTRAKGDGTEARICCYINGTASDLLLQLGRDATGRPCDLHDAGPSRTFLDFLFHVARELARPGSDRTVHLARAKIRTRSGATILTDDTLAPFQKNMSRFFAGLDRKSDTDGSSFAEDLGRFLGGRDGFKRHVAWQTPTRDTVDVHAKFSFLSVAEKIRRKQSHRKSSPPSAAPSAPRAFTRLFTTPSHGTQPRLLPAKTGLLPEDFEAGRFWPRPELQERLADLVANNQIVLVTGPRASGKTSLVRQYAFAHNGTETTYCLQCFAEADFHLEQAIEDILSIPGFFIIEDIHLAAVSIQRTISRLQDRAPDDTRIVLTSRPHLADRQTQSSVDLLPLPQISIPSLTPFEAQQFLDFRTTDSHTHNIPANATTTRGALYDATHGDMWLLTYASNSNNHARHTGDIRHAINNAVWTDMQSTANELARHGFHRPDVLKALAGIALLANGEVPLEVPAVLDTLDLPLTLIDILALHGELVTHATIDSGVSITLPHESLTQAYRAIAHIAWPDCPDTAALISQYARTASNALLLLTNDNVNIALSSIGADRLLDLVCLRIPRATTPLFNVFCMAKAHVWEQYILPVLIKASHIDTRDSQLPIMALQRLLRIAPSSLLFQYCWV